MPPAVFKTHQGNRRQAAGILGKTVTGFKPTPKKSVGLTDVVPFLFEDNGLNQCWQLIKRVTTGRPSVVTDGKLVTARTPASLRGSGAIKLLSLL